MAAVVAIVVLSATPVWAEDPLVDVACKPLADLEMRESFVDLTRDQWEVARGFFYSAPTTPQALPPGDKAMLFDRGADGGALVFVDGDQVCAPLLITPAAVEFLNEIKRGVITHAPGRM